MKKPIVKYEKGVEVVVGEIDSETGEKTMFDEVDKKAEAKSKPGKGDGK